MTIVSTTALFSDPTGALKWHFEVAWVYIPFGSILGPFIVWLMKRDEMLFVDECGRNTNQYKDLIAQREFSGPEARSLIALR
jgi:uncharacterized Tic20 family protein